MAFIITLLIITGVATIAISLKTITYIERTERAIRQRSEECR